MIVAQVAGSKTWKVYGFERRAPLLTDTFDQANFIPHKDGRPYELTAGSVLYVPRGMVHEASANEQPSFHITIGLFPPLWIDLFTIIFVIWKPMKGFGARRSGALSPVRIAALPNKNLRV